MILPRLGLHGKFTLSLMVAAALPFFIGLIALEALGYRYMLEERGREHQNQAATLMAAIQQAANAEGGKLRSWLASNRSWLELLDETAVRSEGDALLEVQQRAMALDEIWPSLPNSDPQISSVISNDLSESFRQFQNTHGTAAEILLTNNVGHIVAATDKPTDFLQSDELWWQRGSQLFPGELWRASVHYDESAQAITIDVVMVLYGQDEMLGVIKLGVEVTELMPFLVTRGVESEASWNFVLRGGHILISSDAAMKPMEETMPFELLDEIRRKKHGWSVAPDADGEEQIMGFTAFEADHLEPTAFVVYSSPSKVLFGPQWRNFVGLMIGGISLLVLCFIAGFFIIQRKVLSPLRQIEMAIRSFSKLTRLRNRATPEMHDQLVEQQQDVEAKLREIQKIRTKDEMELLAHEISIMISRVLHYQSEFDKVEPSKRNGSIEDNGNETDAESAD